MATSYREQVKAAVVLELRQMFEITEAQADDAIYGRYRITDLPLASIMQMIVSAAKELTEP